MIIQFDEQKNAYKLLPEFDQEKKRVRLLGTSYVANDPTGWRLIERIAHDLKTVSWKNRPVTLEPFPAKAKKPPMKWQVEPIRQLLTYRYWALFMEPGLGKTYTAITAMDELARQQTGFRAIVVAPKTLFATWITELKKFAHNLNPILLPDKASVKERAETLIAAAIAPNAVVITNFESFREGKDLIGALLEAEEKTGLRWSMIVLDESSKIRNHTQSYTGLMKVKHLFQRRVIMSGYPAPYAPSDYVYQFAFLQPGILGYADKAPFEWDHSIKDPFGRIIEWKKDSIKWLKEGIREFGYVLHLDDSGLELPPIINSRIYVDMTDEMAKHYNSLAISFITFVEEVEAEISAGEKEFQELMNKLMGWEEGNPKLEDVDVDALVSEKFHLEKAVKEAKRGVLQQKFAKARSLLSLMTRLSQLTGGFLGGITEIDSFGNEITLPPRPLNRNPKLEALLENIDNHPGQQQIVFARYTAEIELIASELERKGMKVAIIKGGVSPAEVGQIVELWDRGELDALVCNAMKASHGLNLQAGSIIHFFSVSYRPDDRVQAMKRTHRLGQTKTVRIYDYVCRGTLDKEVLSVLRRRENLSLAVIKNAHNFVWGGKDEEEVDSYELGAQI